ncbi:hypothetical protein CDAR_523561 [Caerostris darwini]|uniref:Uncharacterized protein n=1 Tax=Caerostris darwini TaxID=1538125 RepID=A0AAV4VQJ4_9ARAC|nr:hypothetical protein CDAR_523561 [Caerostris darwini]
MEILLAQNWRRQNLIPADIAQTIRGELGSNCGRMDKWNISSDPVSRNQNPPSEAENSQGSSFLPLKLGFKLC